MSTHDCKFNPKPFRTCKEGKERQEEKQPLVLVLLELSSLRAPSPLPPCEGTARRHHYSRHLFLLLRHLSFNSAELYISALSPPAC